jgi:polysaccharide chain length determinant protein (PEP-CTERM system associated)
MNHEMYLEMERYVRLLLRRKRLLVLVTLLVMTVGFTVSYVLPKKYQAESTVFIEQSVISDLVKGIAITPSMDAKIKVLSVAMLSRETLTKVLRILDKDVLFPTDAAREVYLDELRKRIDIKLDEKKGVFFITFTDSDPRFARDLVNTITQVSIESNTASKRDESLQATRFLGEQIESFKKRIDAVEDEINAYKAEHGMQLAVDETMIRFEIADAEKKLEAIRARRFELETQQRLLPAGGGQGSALADMQRQLAALRTTYTESHPKVVRLKGEIEALRANPAPASAGSGQAAMTRGMIKAELEANRLQEASQLKAIEDKRQLLRELPTIRTGLNELLRKKENESQIYGQLVTRYGQSEVSKQMEMENKSMTFRIVDPAVLPDKPVSPKRPLIMAGSLVVGLGAGMALIILPYLMGGTVKSLDELRALNLRVLAVIPVIPKPAEELARKKADRVFLAGAFAYFSVLLAVAVLEVLGAAYIEGLFEGVKGLFS